jgi:23S rRNA (cytosine1962-C5)-methyltransferase
MLLSPGGILVTCSCSHLIRYGVFREMLASAAADAKRSFRIHAWRSQGRDHPIVLGIPETEYLKCGFLQAESA